MRLFHFIAFIGFYIGEIVRSNFRVAHDVLTRKHHMTPGVVAVDVSDLNERQTVLMANFITMTPGTLGIYVSDDLNWLYVHSMYIDDDVETLAAELKKNYGERVQRVF